MNKYLFATREIQRAPPFNLPHEKIELNPYTRLARVLNRLDKIVHPVAELYK